MLKQQRHEDERGWFAREFCAEKLQTYGLHSAFPQGNLSHNNAMGTLRGMHFQAAPHGEIKIVRCLVGKVFDVIVDLRANSPQFGQWAGVELTADTGDAIYIPEGFAHGFQTLCNNVLLHYRMGANYIATAAQGIRYDDPAVGIQWPLPVSVIGQRDLNWGAIKSGELIVN